MELSDMDLERDRELRAKLEPIEKRAQSLGEALTGELHERLYVRYCRRPGGVVGWSATLEVTLEQGINRADFASFTTRLVAYAQGGTMPEAAENLVGRLMELSQQRQAQIRLALKEEAEARGERTWTKGK